MATPFDGKLTWWHWRGGAVDVASIDELAGFVRAASPNATGIAVKSSHGVKWQGDHRDEKTALTIYGPRSVAVWADALAAAGLETHLWAVVHGQDVEQEPARLIAAAAVPSVRSMILDVESGAGYFGRQPRGAASRMAATLRAGLPKDFHLGLCVFARDDELNEIRLEEWLPHVDSLHPMVYHWDFSRGTGRPETYLDEAVDRLAPFGRPLVPILGTYPDPYSGWPVSPEHLLEGAHYALELGAAGVSLFRLGSAADGCSAPPQLAAIRRIRLGSPRSLP